jgi:hypothetical protein
VCLDNYCLGAALTLIYSGIDTMACLGMPENQLDVTRKDFVDWCDRYIELDGNTTVTGLEWYAARCGVLHSYGVKSKLSREGKVRLISYTDNLTPAVVFNPQLPTPLVMVSLNAFAAAFSSGIDKSLIHIFSDNTRRNTAEQRLRWMFSIQPYDPNKASLENIKGGL